MAREGSAAVARNRRTAAPQGPQTVRRAIYTRKSTEEGLEQEFNSLDAQREACAAYILSQRHEGWVELPQMYDDGGFSGGNMDRPGLKQLLAEVEAGRVDVIVLYKVDRLTRSLADFARIVEVLDKAGASFVSVTQSFNTTTSMGRLTLNVLLSFAQFEREVTGERIRDKVAASKAKGMWMGGVVPLGYDVVERKLIINEPEAATVRMIFERYEQLGSLKSLMEELTGKRVVSKHRRLSDGTAYGGQPFSRGALSHLLGNRVYIGEVAHREHVYPGEHLPVVNRDLWDRVQALKESQTRVRRTTDRATEPSVLTGMISDGLGRPMTPTHTKKGTRRYRYYVSRTDGLDDPNRPWRLSAPMTEELVLGRLAHAVGQGSMLIGRLADPSAETIELINHRCRTFAEKMASMRVNEAHAMLKEMQLTVRVHDGRVELCFDTTALFDEILAADARWMDLRLLGSSSAELTVPVLTKRRAQELRLVFRPDGAAAPTGVNPALVQLIVRAHHARETLLERAEVVPPSERPHVTRMARFSYLAPDIVTAIMDGKQPAFLSASKLVRAPTLPVCWQAQREAFGFM